MADALAPCSSCIRHIRGSESICPFCGAAASPRPRQATEIFPRLAAAAAVAAGVASLVSCSHETSASSFYGAAGIPGGEESSGSDGGTSSLSGSALNCTASSTCLPGEACCLSTASGAPSTSCVTAPCPGVQVCESAAECLVPGDICSPPNSATASPLAMTNLQLCSTPDGASFDAESDDGARATPSDAGGDSPAVNDRSAADGGAKRPEASGPH
jgi:hypothetical protein